MTKLDKICVHHYGAPATAPNSSQFNFSWQEVNQLHKNQWPDMKSTIGYYVGYNLIIFADGSYKQFRLLGEETVAQVGHNHDAVSICLAGNFSLGSPDRPTDGQIVTLKRIILALLNKQPQSVNLGVKDGTVLDFAASRIYPHRELQPNHTECYGSALDNGWARNLIKDHLNAQIQLLIKLMNLYQKLLSLIKGKKLGSVGHQCLISNNKG